AEPAEAAKPAKPSGKAAAKAAAKSGGGEAIAKVNGVSIPKTRADAMMQQQQGRGAPDNDQTRTAVREELGNREVVAQEAGKAGGLDWTTPTNLDRGFSDAMVKLEKGRYTDAPVQSRFGWHVIQLDDVRSVRIPSLAEIKPRIQQQLVQVKVEEMVRGLRAKAK